MSDLDALVQQVVEQLSANGTAPADSGPEWVSLIIDGRTWLTSGPDRPQPLWGRDSTILAALDQPTTIAGPQGSGKSVFGQRLTLGWLGLVDQVLDLPVHVGDGNALYLAADRPDQARLSMRRMVTDDQLDVLEARLRVWQGPPPEDVARRPTLLREMADAATAGFLLIDSAKDVAIKLSADEVGAAYNSALQHAVAAGVQIVALHHPRKLSGDTGEPVRTLDDLYGSTWVTAGNGSVLNLQPRLGGYTLVQLKAPAGHMAEIDYEHDIAAGDVRAVAAPTVLGVLTEAGDDGVSAVHVARCVYRVDDPDEAQRRKVARVLNQLVDEGAAETVTVGRHKRWRADLADTPADTPTQG